MPARSPIIEETLQLLRSEVAVGDKRYPVFVGFASASELSRLAEAPSFRRDDPHRVIAERVLNPPVSDWQRPLDPERVDQIAHTFSNGHEIMPNPVLLSVNPDASVPSPQPQSSGGRTLPTHSLTLSRRDDEPPPLWILDGQHRISGLSESTQRDNPIPIVLLLNEQTGGPYSGRNFAKIFAQVTVTAKGLDAIHEEWLTYSYQLLDYDDDENADAELHSQAMQSTALLCSDVELNRGSPGRLLNRIKFNPERTIAATPDPGFAYSAPELKQLFHRHYFSKLTAGQDELSAQEFAEQVSEALAALEATVQQPHETSVFFGAGNHGHRYLQLGFLAGVCSRLARHGATDWEALLTDLNFQTADWDFNWVNERGGNIGNTSRRIAINVFSTVLTQGSLPEGTTSLSDFFRGDNAQVAFVLSELTESGRKSWAADKQVEYVLAPGRMQSFPVDGKYHLQFAKPGRKAVAKPTTTNIGQLTVLQQVPKGKQPELPEFLAGADLRDHFDESVTMIVAMEHYGGVESEATVTFKW